MHSFGVAQCDIKLENFILAAESMDMFEGTNAMLEQSPQPSPSTPGRITRSHARVDGAAPRTVPHGSSSLSTAARGYQRPPRVVIVDFARAECDAPSRLLAHEMEKLRRQLIRLTPVAK